MCDSHERPVGLICALTLLTFACGDGTEPITPRELHILSGGQQTTRRGDDVPAPLRVRVIGSDGQPLPAVTVRWAFNQGQATLEPAQTVTSSTGEAETHVTNVATVGTLVVRASVDGRSEPALSGTFSIAALDPCLVSSVPSYQIGTPVTGVLRPLDCRFDDGRLLDFYGFSLTAQQAVALRLRSDSFPPLVGLWTADDVTLRGAVYDDRPGEDALMKAILAPGAYIAGTTSDRAGATGAYEFSTSVTRPDGDACELVLVVRGIAAPLQLASTDCVRQEVEPTNRFYEDWFFIVLYAGESMTATQSSTHFAPRLRLQRRSGAVLADAEGSGTGIARIDFTADSFALYRVTASSNLAQQSGEYTFTVSNPAASATSAATDWRVRSASLSGSAVVVTVTSQP
jgi:hypothetical protein